jgi:tRNA pseudouridine55 synthase
MLLLIDKPKGITSHDVVDIVRKKTGERRVGHAGTLDPMATGLLIVGVGREFTKQLGDIALNTTKTYEAQVTLGANSDTDDAEGVVTVVQVPTQPALGEVKKALKSFEGSQLQTPPNYSAIKLKGKKAYELARKGIYPKLKKRKIVIHSIKLINFDYPILNIVCEVSSGTYIRALARDFGKRLGTGAYLSALRRTSIGHYDIKEAKKLEEI